LPRQDRVAAGGWINGGQEFRARISLFRRVLEAAACAGKLAVSPLHAASTAGERWRPPRSLSSLIAHKQHE
jgi:hypothetical protein